TRRLGTGMRPGQDHLEGAEAVEQDPAGQVDDPHPTPAQLAQDLVAGRPQRLERGGGELGTRQLPADLGDVLEVRRAVTFALAAGRQRGERPVESEDVIDDLAI